MSAVSDTVRPTEPEWRRRRLRVAITTFVATLLAGLVTDLALLPFVVMVVGLVLLLARRDSPVGPGVMRGAALVLWLYLLWLVVGLALGSG